jgi:hypothetical protein
MSSEAALMVLLVAWGFNGLSPWVGVSARHVLSSHD